MSIKKLSAGDIIEARCTKCREVLNHRIVAMVEEKVVRVECNTCNGVHNYHAPPIQKADKTVKVTSAGKPKKAPAVPRVSKKDPAESDREEWASLSPTFDAEKAAKYDMNGRYNVKRLVQHPVFGIGIVKALIVPNKMQILFKDGIKLLRCQHQ
ncbi:MAG: hypothetical protein PHN84_02270 [Desulfuromonadaceae bacterium]|nr:hypothetical protein [Desulfuromonadaceae bacterium]MDD2856139.1 hypothetical protein [Desulfuromonadaceae bacterium]